MERMPVTSDERREVAARMRDGGVARNAEEAYVLVPSCVVVRPQLLAKNTYQRAMQYLVDLVDQTCEAVKSDAGMDDELVCSVCGAQLGIEVNGRCAHLPNYCPCCGSRVVRDDGHER